MRGEDHRLVSKQINLDSDYLITCCQGQQLYIYIGYRGPILDLTDEAQSRQEIEFLLLGATTESNMAAILDLERNYQIAPTATGNGSPCCQGQQQNSRWLPNRK